MDAIEIVVLLAGASVSCACAWVAREIRMLREAINGPREDVANPYRRPIRPSLDPASRV